MNPMEGGDDLQQALNMQPAGGGPDQNEQGGQPGKGLPKQKPQEEPEEPTAFEKRKKTEAQPAFGILLDEAARRIASHEVTHLEKRSNKAAEDHDRWMEFARDFYATKQIPYIVKTLDPICAAWLAATDERCAPERMADVLVQPIGPIFDRDINKSGILAEWKTTRADQIAAALKQEFFG